MFRRRRPEGRVDRTRQFLRLRRRDWSRRSHDRWFASGSTSVTLTETGFVNGSTVFLTNAATNVTVVSSTSITVRSPAGATGTSVNVTVTTPGGTSAPALANLYGYGAPTVRPLARLRRPTLTTDTMVTITGTGFVPAPPFPSEAQPPPVRGELLHLDDGHLSERDLGQSVNVTVTTPGGTSANVVGDLYGTAPRRLRPNRLPTNATMDTTVIITGTGFVPALPSPSEAPSPPVWW